MEQDEWEKMIMATKSSQSYKKIENYVKELLRREDFKNDIKDMRTKFSIVIRNKTYSEYTTYQPEVKDRKGFYAQLKELMKKYHLNESSWYETIEHYIYYDKYQEFSNSLHQGLIYAEDIKAETDDHNATVYNELVNEKEIFEKASENTFLFKDNEHYPVALRISPWATKRDILDYVKNNYSSFIEKIQKRYQTGTNIATLKTKSKFIQERNDFIWENKELPRKEIMSLLYKKYTNVEGFDIDEANISKIISLRKKKNSISE
jgi:hypothetical protein